MDAFHHAGLAGLLGSAVPGVTVGPVEGVVLLEGLRSLAALITDEGGAARGAGCNVCLIVPVGGVDDGPALLTTRVDKMSRLPRDR